MKLKNPNNSLVIFRPYQDRNRTIEFLKDDVKEIPLGHFLPNCNSPQKMESYAQSYGLTVVPDEVVPTTSSESSESTGSSEQVPQGTGEGSSEGAQSSESTESSSNPPDEKKDDKKDEKKDDKKKDDKKK